MTITRRSFLATATAAPALARTARPPNIVWIMADDLGYGEVGCYGQRNFATPNIDHIAQEGLRFTDAYAGCTVCAPSRSVLMTGLNMGHTPVRSNNGGVPLLVEEHTVADLLRDAGYTNGGFGKWGLGDVGTTGVPTRHGFHEFFGYLHQVHAHYHYPSVLYDGEREVPLPGNADHGRKTYANDAIVARALAFLEKNRRRPFFCYMPLTVPHWEPLVPEDSIAPFRGKIAGDTAFVDPHHHFGSQPHLWASRAGMITRLDRYVGQVLDTLARLKLAGNTIVVFTSDNGGPPPDSGPDLFHTNGPFRGYKGTMYEGGIRIPLIVRWPGNTKPGGTTAFPCSFCDFMPTAAEWVQARVPSACDGVSLVPVLRGGSPERRGHLYWELPRYVAATGEFRREAPMQALRKGDWKVVRPKPDGALELYDLSSDPGEAKDLAAVRPEVLEQYRRELAAARVEPRPQKDHPHPWDSRS